MSSIYQSSRTYSFHSSSVLGISGIPLRLYACRKACFSRNSAINNDIRRVTDYCNAIMWRGGDVYGKPVFTWSDEVVLEIRSRKRPYVNHVCELRKSTTTKKSQKLAHSPPTPTPTPQRLTRLEGDTKIGPGELFRLESKVKGEKKKQAKMCKSD